jgi:hypothetical protein
MHVFHSTVPQTRFLAKLHDERPAIEEDSYGASSCGKWVQSTKGERGSRMHVGTGIKYEDIQTLNLYWTQVRQLYACLEPRYSMGGSTCMSSTLAPYVMKVSIYSL